MADFTAHNGTEVTDAHGAHSGTADAVQSPRFAEPPGAARILAASFVGTAIEFFDFYIFSIATALVIGPAFFPVGAPGTQQLAAFVTFAVAFLARPVGAALFGHFGDRIGRKHTLVTSLVIVGLSTVLVGCLPTYASIGWWAPALLCVLRCAQGIGVGGEWGGAALLAVENAPPGRRAWYGIFPQLGPPAGFALANLSFLVLSFGLSPADFLAWGWRLPFLTSAVLVIVGLYVRVTLTETPAFRAALAQAAPERVPLAALLGRHGKPVATGMLAMVAIYATFYITTVFALSYGTDTLGFTKPTFLLFECVAVCFMAVGTLASGPAADHFGRRPVLLSGMAAVFGLGLLIGPMLGAGAWPPVLGFLCLSFLTMGWTFGPMGATLPELFPTRVRYTGATLAYNLGGILGASGAPYLAQRLVSAGGIAWVGAYLAAAAVISLLAVLAMPETGRDGIDV